MRLKRLELYGYKSFATRIAFEFGEGITAIVGPNGSGKSNAADAMRWVMGEQSYRSLRAKSTEDMIFAGSRQRARLGMAEVLITLDNTEGWLPIDFTEVTVGRRAYRSGENEYLLNGRRVRYRDVLELLGGAGLMGSNYTVIGQGMVDAALSLRPEARRVLFEEAAGIAPHLRKREEALRGIEETERNLERVNDILNEMRPRASALRRQSERAEEHLLLSQDLRELQRIWYGYHWQRRQRQLTRTEEYLRERAALLEAQRTYARGFQEKQDQLAARQAAQRQVADKLAAEQASLRDSLARVQREQAVAAERQRLLQQQRTAMQAETQALDSRREVLQKEIARATQDLDQEMATLEKNRQELQQAHEALRALEVSRRAVVGEMDIVEAHLRQATATFSDGQSRLEHVMERRARLKAQDEETQARLAELREHLRAIEAQGQVLAERERAAGEAFAGWQARHAQLEAEVVACREQIAASEKALARLRAAHEQLDARYDLLTRQRQEGANYNPGAREVLASNAGLSGLLGSVASLMQVPANLEQAVESALGPRLQNIVAERWEDAEAAIEHLKHTRAGWATFLPLDTLRSRPALSIRSGPGIVGVASALVRYEERLRPAFELLLGSVVVVADLPTARRLLRERTGASLFVTLEGDTVQPSGALSGGARRQASHLLAQEREWRELPQRLAASEAQLQRASAELVEQEAQLAQRQRQLQECACELARSRTERDTAHTALTNHVEQSRDEQRERAWLDSRHAQALQEREALASQEEGLHQKLASAQQVRSTAETRIRELREQLDALGGDDLRQKVAELETHTAVAERTVRSQHTLCESHRANLAQLSQQIEAKGQEAARLETELARSGDLSRSARARLGEIERATVELQGRREPALQELSALDQERRDLERQRSLSVERLNEAELDFSRAALERDRARDELSVLTREIEADLGPIGLPETISRQLRLNLGDDVIELPSVDSLPPGMGDEIRQLKARLRRLGDVNPSAPREYEQLIERQTFLQGQAADLRGAIAGLHEVIQELDTTIERDFVMVVNSVDAAFREYFRTLFNGGSARLELTDPANPSTSGVDIVAQPPGKRAQNLALLSGGERALTAVALLFALLRANPVPFCFLDEVDAALDEANVSRFRDLLREHARSIQFVMITHNRYTVEAASTIYGISMGEQGVSECISLKLGEAIDPSVTA